ncbi:MAG: hypothetical protein Q9222_005468 [Ikaeria aurantiellina]
MIRHKERPESGDGYHDDGDTALLLSPESKPDDVNGAGMFVPRYLYDSDNDHDGRKTERETKGNLLANTDSYTPEERYRNGDQKHEFKDTIDEAPEEKEVCQFDTEYHEEPEYCRSIGLFRYQRKLRQQLEE